MYLSIKELAFREGLSVSQIFRNVHEMEKSGKYPRAVKECKGLKVKTEDYDDFLFEKRRVKFGRKGEI